MQNTLRQLRIMKGDCSATVAAAVGISKQRYHNIEKNGIATAKEEALARAIADYFGVSVFELLGSDNLKIKPRDDKEAAIAKKYAFQQPW